MTNRGSFTEVIKPGGRVPKGKAYKSKKVKTDEKADKKGKETTDVEGGGNKFLKGLKRRGGRKMSA